MSDFQEEESFQVSEAEVSLYIKEFFESISKNDSQRVEELLEKYPSLIDAVDEDGCNAITLSTLLENAEVALALIKYDPNPHLPSNDGFTAFDVLEDMGNEESQFIFKKILYSIPSNILYLVQSYWDSDNMNSIEFTIDKFLDGSSELTTEELINFTELVDNEESVMSMFMEELEKEKSRIIQKCIAFEIPEPDGTDKEDIMMIFEALARIKRLQVINEKIKEIIQCPL